MCGVRFNSTPRQQSCSLPLTGAPLGCGAKIKHRTNVWRQFPGFAGNFDTGIPEITVSVTASIRQQRIGAAEGEELFVRSLLGDAAVLDDSDAVGIADG